MYEHAIRWAARLAPFFLGSVAAAQDWVVTFDGPSSVDITEQVLTDAAGNAFQVGSSGSGNGQDLVALSYDDAGNLRWSVRIDGGHGLEDWVRGACLDPHGDLCITYRAGHPTQGSNFGLVKVRGTDGSVMWNRSADGGFRSIDQPNDIDVDRDGNFLVGGLSYNDVPDGDYYTLLYDNDGRILWRARYAGPGPKLFANDVVEAVAFDPVGDVLVTGGSPASNGIDDYVTVKYSRHDGTQLWFQRYQGGSNETAKKVAVDASGTCFVSGHTGEAITTIAHNGVDGTILWMVVDDPGGHDEINDLLVLPSGDVLWVGTSDPDFDESNINDDAIAIRRSGVDGSLQWRQRLGGSKFNEWEGFRSVARSGASLLCAGSKIVNGQSFDVYAVSLKVSDGTVEWIDTESGPAGEPDGATSVAVSSQGDVYVGGSLYSFATGSDYALLHYTVDPALAPTDIEILGADSQAGSAKDLLRSDDRWLAAARSGGLWPKSPLEFVLHAFGAPGNSLALTFEVELSSSAHNTTEVVELYDFVQQSWIRVAKRIAPTQDRRQSFVAPGNSDDYVGPGGEVRARLRFVPASPFGTTVARLDRVRWMFDR